MKLIHCADIHLGSKINSFSPEVNNDRRGEVLASFSNLVEYAAINHIATILISGDMFDSDQPAKKDYNNVKTIFKAHPDITFYYLKGNHDNSSEENFFSDYPNVKTFSTEKWTSYPCGEHVVITGRELTYTESDKDVFDHINEDLVLDKTKINIVMLHGEINKDINLNALAQIGVNYCALGHIHKGSIETKDNMIYAYPGCLEGRGFDECGPKGFIECEITDNKINPTPILNASRTIESVDYDVTGLTSEYDIAQNIAALDLNELNIYRINCKGSVKNTLDLTLIKQKVLELKSFYYLEIKDSTQISIDYHDYLDDISLVGAFTREADKIEDEALKQAVIQLGYEKLGVKHE